MEMTLRRLTLLCSSALLVLSTAQAKNSLDVHDLLYRAALYQQHMPDQQLEGVANTFRLIADAPDEAAQYESRTLLIDMLNAYGMHYQSVLWLDKLVNRRFIPYPVRDRSWLNLAKNQYERGYYSLTGMVESSLGNIKDTNNIDIRGDRIHLLSQLLMKQQRYQDAAKLLERWDGPAEQLPYAQYNLGVALINMDAESAGIGMLEKVGRLADNSSAELLAIRDSANFNLAHYHLLKERAGSAKPLLKRVRLDGPYSNDALLALGWAEMGERGPRVNQINYERQGCLPVAVSNLSILLRVEGEECAAETSFARGALNTNEKAQFRAALTPWFALKQRSTNEPPVQEALLSVPYALEQLGQTDRAIAHYKDAIQRFISEKTALDRAQQRINSKAFANILRQHPQRNERYGNWALKTDPDQQLDILRLQELVASHTFRSTLENYWSLLDLKDNLNAWSAKVRDYQNQFSNRITNFQNTVGNLQNASLRVDQNLPFPGSQNSNRANPVQTLNNSVLVNLKLSNNLTTAGTASTAPEKPLAPRQKSAKPLQEQLASYPKTLKILRANTISTLRAHETLLRKLISTELNTRKARLNIYLSQTYISLAKLFDALAVEAETTGTAEQEPANAL